MATEHKIKFLHLTSLTICALLLLQFGTHEVIGQECARSNAVPGNEPLRDEWPFVVALYLSDDSKHFCGGTLISNKHILTAAHCIQGKGSQLELKPNEIFVRLGAYNLTENLEEGSVTREVTEIHIHPDWKIDDQREQYDANLAILVLNENVTFTNYIRQVCMPTDDVLAVDTTGFIAGWGFGRNSAALHSQILKHAETKLLDHAFCIRPNSNSTFCGDCKEGSSIQHDNGGGFFVLSGSVWKLYGMTLPASANTTNHFTVTSFAYTKKWIVETVEKSGSAVSQVEKINVHLECGKWKHDNMYSCEARMNVSSDNVEVDDAIGSHSTGKSKLDVEYLQFLGSMKYVPDGIGKTFKNLKSLQFCVGDIQQVLRRSFLKNMEKLTEFVVCGDETDERIEEDLLYDLPNLEKLFISVNSFKEVGKQFINNPKLREVSLLSAKLKVLPKYLFNNNIHLEKVQFDQNNIKSITQQIFANNSKLSEVYLSENHLKEVPHNLFQNNLLLRKVNFSNNRLKRLSANLFKNNLLLVKVDFSHNRLEQLPANLFKSNLKLEVVDFKENNLKFIDINFAAFMDIKEIYLTDNNCTGTNSKLNYIRNYDYDIHGVYDFYANLNKLQNAIGAKCSSKKP